MPSALVSEFEVQTETVIRPVAQADRAAALYAYLSEIGSGYIEPTAYDTAWVARVPDRSDPRRPAYPAALDWLLNHQRPDGSWGAHLPYHHDRLLSTLVATLTLTHWSEQLETDAWSARIASGLAAIWRYLPQLQRDPYDTIGFELIVPTLLDEARAKRLALPHESFKEIVRLGEQKLKLIPPERIYTRYVSTIFSAEFLGDRLDVGRVHDLQDDNGSIASSPSATAYYLLKDPDNWLAREYLAGVLARHDNAAPAVDPIDVFEIAWVLFHAAQVWPDSSAIAERIAPHVDVLADEFRRKQGAGYNSYFAVPDLDGTSMVFRILTWAGLHPDPALLGQFEADDHFRCFPYERNPSISAHVHLLDALRTTADFPDRARMMDKARAFLARSRTLGTFWFDKWHASPYYTTAHAILALGDTSELTEQAVAWIVNTQKDDGTWGYYACGTAEETAYSVLALAAYQDAGGRQCGVSDAMRRGVDFLLVSGEHRRLDYTPLWIGKSLYTPTRVAHSAVLAALAVADRG